MFTITAINNSVRLDDGALGTMHLNALNGSSAVLGCGSSSDLRGNQSAYGGLFGVSLSDNHPYRPLDSGRTFLDSSTSKTTTPSAVRHEGDAKSPDEGDTTTTNQNVLFRRRHRRVPITRKSFEELSSSPSSHGSCSSLRRHSFDLDTKASTTHVSAISDLSLSLEEIVDLRDDMSDVQFDVMSPTPRRGSKDSQLDSKRLSLTEVNITTAEGDDCQHSKYRHHHHHQHHHHHHNHNHNHRKTKKDYNIAVDASICSSERASKILEKIREGKKGDNHKSSSSRHKDHDPHTAKVTSATIRPHGTPRSKGHRSYGKSEQE